MDQESNPKVNKEKWEDVYSQEKGKLPWLENPLPERILQNFSSHFTKGDKILDYGCGDGALARILINKELNVICSDISKKALLLVSEKNPGIQTFQAENPSEIANTETFDGIVVWGVLHHIDIKLWDEYVGNFSKITKEGGYLLFGGHSMKDEEFTNGFRMSPTTGDMSNAIDSLENILPKHNLNIIDLGYFDFTEAFTGKDRAFKFFIAEKVSK